MSRSPSSSAAIVLSLALVLAACEGDEQDGSDGSMESANDGGTRDARARDAANETSRDGESAAPEAVNHLASSASHNCALREAGLYCWGDNTSGQLGTGDIEEHARPVAARVAGRDIVEIAAASGRTCVRREDGTVACWGGNDYGQLGDGTLSASREAVMVAGVDDARQLALNEESTCVLRADGSVTCWGGALDAGSALLRPTRIAGLPKQVEISRGGQSAFCGRDAQGAVRCWSHDWNVWSEARLVMLTGAKALAMTSMDEICALMKSGEILCHNLENGHLIPLDDSEGSMRVTSGPLVACAKKSDPNWRCWNVLPPMLEESGSSPIPLISDVPLVELAVAGWTGCALREDRKVSCLSVNDLLPTWRVVEDLPD
jgi:hypothetical protein